MSFVCSQCILLVILLGVALFQNLPCSNAFGNHYFAGKSAGGGNNNGRGNTPMVLDLAAVDDNDNDNDNDNNEDICFHNNLLDLRGGKTSSGPLGIFAVISEFWNSTFQRASSSIQNIFQKESKAEKDLLNQLQTMPIKVVTVPNTTVLPPEVIRVAVKRSGMIGNPLRTDKVQEVAKNIKRWYLRNGYILHTVTGANLRAESATAEITVEEPKNARSPVGITVCKEMVIDESDGEVLTFRQYVAKQSKKKSFRYDRIERKDLNTTLVEADGRTDPNKIAKALKLRPGKPFQWNADRWQKIATSGVFSNILKVSPRRLRDGTVQLEVFATEPPPRHLEYGLGKSLYTGSWEGEVDFEHQNLFGGSEVLGLMVRRGTKDVEPSIKLRYSDDHFGMEGGYDVELFSDFLGDTASTDSEEKNDSSRASDLCFRKGGTVRIQNPISTTVLRNSIVSTSLERTSSGSGEHEKIGSSTLTFGPIRMPLPLDARSSIVTSITGGARLPENGERSGETLPYSSGSFTTRQIFPLSDPMRNPPVLALQHTLATSSQNLPKHDAKAMGVSAQIRGCDPFSSASSTIKGTAEVRVPVRVPRVENASFILFGDWFCVQQGDNASFKGKSSVGFGLRKVISGLPLKYDVCYTSDGKIKTMFGLGPDFDV